MDASTLVIAEKEGKKGTHEVKFVLDPAVQKDGAVAVGSNVQVKYHNDANQHIRDPAGHRREVLTGKA